MTETSGQNAAIPACVYRLLPRTDWLAAVHDGIFRGSADDLRDGFIHLSTAAQVETSADRYYRGIADVLLLTLDSRRLGEGLRMEPSTGGQSWPHLYGIIPVEAVLEATALSQDSEGRQVIPFLRQD